MPARETAGQAAGEGLLYGQRAACAGGPGIEAGEPHRGGGTPIPSGTGRSRSRGGLEVLPGGHGAAHGRSRFVDHLPREASAALASVRDGSLPRSHLLWAAAFLLLEVIADDVPGDLDASARILDRDLELTEPDLLFPALIRVALGLLGPRAGSGPAEAILARELAGLLGEASGPAPAPAEPLWPAEPLTQSETRVLRYLPTHMRAPEIAAELCLSANTVKTHLRHLYRKLGAHNRPEAVQRARAIGLLAGPCRRP